MSFTQIVGKLDESSRNLNTSPWTISGLKGDQFDYSFMVFCDSSADTGNNDLKITINSDTGANYDNYRMSGQGTSRNVSNSPNETQATLFRFTSNEGSRNSHAVGSITGDSSQDRVIKSLYSQGEPMIANGYSLWTNNIDELTSITFTSALSASCKWHIVVFEVPKVGNGDNWELIDTLSWSASSAEQSFSGLEGDTDIQYMINVPPEDDGTFLYYKYNGDASASYIQQYVYNNGSSFVANRNTGLSESYFTDGGDILINAETGRKRTSFHIGGPYPGSKHEIRANWYSNTATEITSLAVEPNSSTTRTIKLFRRKNPKIPADMFRLPFEKIDEIDVDSADFSTGESFTGLEGDKVLMYRLEYNGLADGGFNLYTNGDTGGSDYARQNLRGQGTAESAGSDTSAAEMYWMLDSNADSCNTVMYIYPQSGEYRPSLMYRMGDEDQIDIFAQWRLDSATEITSLLIKSAGTGTVEGKFTLSAIYL